MEFGSRLQFIECVQAVQTTVEHMQVALQCRDAWEQPHEQGEDYNDVSRCDTKASFAEHKRRGKKDKCEKFKQSAHDDGKNRGRGGYLLRFLDVSFVSCGGNILIYRGFKFFNAEKLFP